MKSTLFWCGSIALLHHLQYENENNAFILRLEDESIQGKDYTYTVSVNGVRYYYKFTMSSNIKLSSSFFIESDDWKSQVYTVDKQYDFVHITETAIDFHDIYFLGALNMIDIYIRNGKKTSISTISVTKQLGAYHVDPIAINVDSTKSVLNAMTIMYLFAMSGAIDRMKTTVNDVICFAGSVFSLVTYADGPIQIMGVVTRDTAKTMSTLQCINSFYNQKYTFTDKGIDHWDIGEYVDGILGTYRKRHFEFAVKEGYVMNLTTGEKYAYSVEDNRVVYRKSK